MYQFSIQESAPIGTAVGRVKAEDSDVGENTDMTYLLKEESGTGGHVFKVTTDSDTQEAIILLQKVPLPRLGGGRGGVREPWTATYSHPTPLHSTPLQGLGLSRDPGPTWENAGVFPPILQRRK